MSAWEGNRLKGSLAKKALIVVGVLAVLLAGAIAWWMNGAYRADVSALAAVADEDGAADGVTVRELSDGRIAFVSDDPVAGMVFYPGARVQPEAYAPLLTRLARAGVTCVLVRPPLDFALLDIDAADGVREQFPEVGTWLLGGHSLGGVAACEYLAQHEADFDGVVLLASYPNSDLTDFAGFSLQLVGSEDGVVNRDSYDGARHNLPEDAHELVIEGGNHAQFGNYGEQSGDGTASITGVRQQEQTVEAVLDLLDAA